MSLRSPEEHQPAIRRTVHEHCDVVWQLDLASGRLQVDDRMRSEWGHDLAARLDRDWWLDRVHPGDRAHVVRTIDSCIESGDERCAIEYRFAHADGTYGHVLDRLTVVRDDSGRAVQILGSMHDVSARKEAEEALAEAQHLAKIGRWSADRATHRLRWSEETYWILGLPPGSAASAEAFLSVVHPLDREIVMPLARELCNGPSQFRFRVVRLDQTVRIVHARVRCGPETIVATLQDITEMVSAQETIRALRREAEVILEHAGDGIIAVDRRCRATRVNPAAARILGLEVDELMAAGDLHARLHHTRPDGTTYPRDECPLIVAMTTGRATSGDETVWRSDGTPRFLHCTCTPLEGGGAVIAFQDLTERIRLERQLKSAERVSYLGRVAATITHEFNNVLMGMTAFAEIIARHASDERSVKAAAYLMRGIQRGKQITAQILSLAQTADPKTVRFDVAEWLRRHHAELSAAATESVEVWLVVDDEPLPIRCDPAQLQQVMANLVINAADAMDGKGVIEIRARRDGSDAVIDVADQGQGIPPAVLPDIFEPLFTTKRHGTGLGLAVVQQFVVRNGGTIDVESRVGEGTTFVIRFPVAEE